MTDDEQLKAAERGPFEEWAIRSGAAWRDPQIGVCFYSAGDGNPSWKAWLARAALRAAPGREPAAVPPPVAQEPVAWQFRRDDESRWETVFNDSVVPIYREHGFDVRPLYAAPAVAQPQEPVDADANRYRKLRGHLSLDGKRWRLCVYQWTDKGEGTAVRARDLDAAIDSLPDDPQAKRPAPARFTPTKDAAPAVAQEARDAAPYFDAGPPRAQVRQEALEEAALIAEKWAADGDWDADMGKGIAHDIRALKDQP